MGYRDDDIGEEEGEDGKTGHPVIAIIVCFVLAIASAATPNFDSEPGLPFLLGYVVGGSLLICLIAWAITIRHASRGWQVGSLTAIFLIMALGSLSRIGQAREIETADARAIAAQFRTMTQTGELSEVKAGTSPLGQMMATMVNGVIADQKAFNKNTEALGLEEVITFEGLSPQSAVLDRCASFGGLAEQAHSVGARLPRHIAAAQATGERLSVPQGNIQAFVRGASESAPTIRREWDLNAEIVREAQGICEILARGHWRRESPRKILITDARQLAEANRHLSRIVALQGEVKALAAAGSAKMEQGLAAMERR